MKYLIMRTQTYSGDTLWSNLPENKKKNFELVFIQDFLTNVFFTMGNPSKIKFSTVSQILFFFKRHSNEARL
jgi:hypothetical protein